MTTLHTVAATGALRLSWLLLAFPLFGAVVLLVGGRRTDRWGHLLGVAMPVASFVYGLIAFFSLLGDTHRSQDLHLYTYIVVGGFQVNMGLLTDQLSICFVLLITGVGSLIHIYSVGYMAHDTDRRRFFGYLNLFVASMLLLVLADNYLGLYIGWEGVGLASYLLIGFWQFKPTAAVAAKKAFIANRVGDAGLSIAIFLMFAEFGTVAFPGVFGSVHSGGSGVATALGLLLLLGACGKSAQVPLQSWLLDAMEGPTPVSALIHAATMVTAGVYLLVRSSPILDLTSTARLAITVVGAVTLLFGAIIGCAKDDIKKALAGSTMSQIGYMTLAAGLGPGRVRVRHRPPAGARVLQGRAVPRRRLGHARHERRGEHAPVRRAVAVHAGYLRHVSPGLPGDHRHPAVLRVLHQGPHHRGRLRQGRHLRGHPGCLRGGRSRHHLVLHVPGHAHDLVRQTQVGDGGAEEYTRTSRRPMMIWPMILLAVGSVGAGGFLIIGQRLENFLGPVTGFPPTAHGIWSVSGVVTLVLVLAAIGLAWVMYGRVPVPAVAPRGRFPVVAARKDLYGDAFNESVLMRPGQWLTRLSVYFDNRGVDGLVNTIAAAIGGTSGRVRKTETGFVRSYALSMFAGAAVLVALLLVVRL